MQGENRAMTRCLETWSIIFGEDISSTCPLTYPDVAKPGRGSPAPGRSCFLSSFVEDVADETQKHARYCSRALH